MKHRGKQWRARGAVFQFENARQLQIARCVASQEAGVNEGDGSIAFGGQSAATYDIRQEYLGTSGRYIVGVDHARVGHRSQGVNDLRHRTLTSGHK